MNDRSIVLVTSNQISHQDHPDDANLVSTGVEPPTPELPSGRPRFPKQWLSLSLRQARQKLLTEFERMYLVSLLESTGGRIGETARRAGIQPRSLFEKMQRHKLKKEDFRPRRK